MIPMTKSDRSASLFRRGYNCAQAVALAFEDELNMELDEIAKMASSFGCGMGRLREVCGSVSAMFLVYGIIKGYSDPNDKEGKAQQYKTIQEMAAEFEKRHGSIVCHDILKKPAGRETFVPAERTAEYYASRPCERCVADAADILETFLRK